VIGGRTADRHLCDLNGFSATIGSSINDLQVTSPHGSDFRAIRKFLELHRFERRTRHSNGTVRSVSC
jgi:hypothetical protein